MNNLKPYDESDIWNIQEKYYINNSKKIWENKEIPFYISNSVFSAFQNAEVIKLYIKKSNSSKIRILEIGSGSGIFAFNLSKELESFDIEYYITDISFEKLNQLKESNNFNQEKFKFYYFNFNNFKSFDLDNKEILFENNYFDIVIANYVLCTIPPKIIKKINDEYYEKYVSFDSKLNNIELKDLEIKYSYLKINNINSIFNSDKERNIFYNFADDYNTCIIQYPQKLIKVIDNILKLIKTNGLLIISDSAFTDNYQYFKIDKEHLCHHNTISNLINFPFLKRYYNKDYYSSFSTSDDRYFLQTLIIQKSDEIDTDILNTFKEYFVISNYNNEFSNIYTKISQLMKSYKYEEAIFYAKKIYNLFPNDPLVNLVLGICYLKLNNCIHSLKHLDKGKKLDIFKVYNFDINIGMCFYTMGKIELSKKYFKYEDKEILEQLENIKFF
jgi:SAM-dependent methyltransferase